MVGSDLFETEMLVVFSVPLTERQLGRLSHLHYPPLARVHHCPYTVCAINETPGGYIYGSLLVTNYFLMFCPFRV